MYPIDLISSGWLLLEFDIARLARATWRELAGTVIIDVRQKTRLRSSLACVVKDLVPLSLKL